MWPYQHQVIYMVSIKHCPTFCFIYIYHNAIGQGDRGNYSKVISSNFYLYYVSNYLIKIGMYPYMYPGHRYQPGYEHR